MSDELNVTNISSLPNSKLQNIFHLNVPRCPHGPPLVQTRLSASAACVDQLSLSMQVRRGKKDESI